MCQTRSICTTAPCSVTTICWWAALRRPAINIFRDSAGACCSSSRPTAPSRRCGACWPRCSGCCCSRLRSRAGLPRATPIASRGPSPASPTSPAAIAAVKELSQAYGEMTEALERSREQIVRAGKLAVVGEMAAIMVHEVRTPLGILRSSAQLLARQPHLDEKGRELTGFIISETDRLNRLVTLLLETASPRPPHFRPHNLNEIVDHALDLLAGKAEKKEVRLQRALSAAETMLTCDREQLIQVFLNLLINALHFAPVGGRIEVATHNRDGTLVASVADDGPGVPFDLRARIFDPIFTRREGGIGLGLTIVQQIVQAHRARISVGESAWGGASFDFEFDLHAWTDEALGSTLDFGGRRRGHDAPRA